MECKLRWVNFRRVSDYRRAFRLAFRVTEISDDWYRSTRGVMVIGLGTPRCTGESFWCTWECWLQVWEHWWQDWVRWQQVWEHLESRQGTPSSLGMVQACLECCRCAWNAAGAPGIRQVCQGIIATTYRSKIVKIQVFRLYSPLCINVSMYLYSYPSTHGISALAAGGAWEQFEVHLKMTIQ